MKIALYCLLMALAACTHKNPYVSAEFRMYRAGDLLVSESPSIWRTSFVAPLETFDFQAEAIVRNAGEKSIRIQLDWATLRTNSDIRPIRCQFQNESSKVVELPPQKSIHLTCKAVLKPSSENELSKKDTFIRVEIPTSQQAIILERLVRSKDFP